MESYHHINHKESKDNNEIVESLEDEVNEEETWFFF